MIIGITGGTGSGKTTLLSLAREQGYQVLTLQLQGSIPVLYGRFLNRIHNENRHPVHICEEFDTLEGFREYIESLRCPNIPGDVLPIQAGDFSYQADPQLLAKIDTFMK
jgi:hypothetical protein